MPSGTERSRQSRLQAMPNCFPEVRAFSLRHHQERKANRTAQAGRESRVPQLRASNTLREGDSAAIPERQKLQWGNQNATSSRFEGLRRLWFSLVPRDRWRGGLLQGMRGEIRGFPCSAP
jgi:hypothetical protein